MWMNSSLITPPQRFKLFASYISALPPLAAAAAAAAAVLLCCCAAVLLLQVLLLQVLLSPAIADIAAQ